MTFLFLDVGIERKSASENLKQLLQRARETKLKVNKKKLNLCLSEVSYLGHWLMKDGLCADPAKVKASNDMLRPDEGSSRMPTVLV